MFETKRCVKYRRGGFTLLELLVCIAIVGILLTLILPAVQQVRSTSRRMQCLNNMHQFGLACHQHLEVEGHFPAGTYDRDLLPYLEQPVSLDHLGTTLYALGTLEKFGEEDYSRSISIPVYACPSDPLQDLAKGRVCSYHLNVGTGYGDNSDGFRQYHGPPISAKDVTDGLSNTVAFSEKLLYPGSQWQLYPSETVVELSDDLKRRRMATTDPFREAHQMDLFADACGDQPVWFGGQAGGFHSIFDTNSGEYNHIMTPNSNSCYNGFPVADLYTGPVHEEYAAKTATSYHNGLVVNVLLGDGSARAIGKSIDRKIWRALGTRAGGEAVSSLH